MRLLLSKSNKELRHLVEKGGEAHKVDTTRSRIDKLSMEIQIAIQVVATVSKKINAVRDEELWPQVTELVLGYATTVFFAQSMLVTLNLIFQMRF